MTLSPLVLAVGKFNLSGSVIAAVKVAAHFADTLGEPRTNLKLSIVARFRPSRKTRAAHHVTLISGHTGIWTRPASGPIEDIGAALVVKGGAGMRLVTAGIVGDDRATQ